eukprot:g4176.t1
MSDPSSLHLSPKYSGGDRKRAQMIKRYPDIKEDSLPPSLREIWIMTGLYREIEIRITDAKECNEMKRQCTERLLLTFVRGFVTNRYKELPLQKAIKATSPIMIHCLRFRARFDCVDALRPKGKLKLAICPKDERVYDREWIKHVMKQTDPDGRLILLTSPFTTRFMKHFAESDGKAKEAFLRHQILSLERQNRIKDLHEAKSEKLLYKHILIVDMGLSSLTMAKANYIKAISACAAGTYPEDPKRADNFMSDYYPETLLSLWAVNVPLMFRTVWAVAKMFIDPITVKKFKLVAGVPLKDMVQSGVPLEAIPKYLGGKGENPRGYHYKFKVPAAKKSHIPHSYSIKKGEKIVWDVSTTQEYTYCVPKFDGHPLKSWGGGGAPGKGYGRVKIRQNHFLKGSFLAPGDGVFTLEFDNTEFNWFGAEVLYEVTVNPVDANAMDEMLIKAAESDSSEEDEGGDGDGDAMAAAKVGDEGKNGV